MSKLSDEQIKSICNNQMRSSTGWQNGELADERSSAMDYYLGKPYGDEEEGESQVVTREVLDTVEWILPSLIRIFTDQENAVEFTPVSQEDEEQAKQETDVVNHVCWNQNDGFLNLYTALKDGLLSKTGVLKIFWDDSSREEREEYKGLNDIELSLLFGDKTVEREVIGYNQDNDGHHVVLKTKSLGKIKIIPCPPEEIGVNKDARSPNIQECNWVHHRVRKTKSDLIEEGFDRKKIESLPGNEDGSTIERLSRRHLTDEDDNIDYNDHWSMQAVWVTECYIKIDRNDDGIAELLKVTLAAGSSDSSAGSIILDIEEVDVIPFVSYSPIILTHKYYGLSPADLVMEIQKIKSTILRGSLTNMYLSNNQRVHINERVNLDDLLTSRPGGVIRHAGRDIPSNNFSPHPHQPVPQQSFDLLQYMDEERKDRVGVSDITAGLEATSLSNINTGVMMEAVNASRMKIELIARICAEVMFRPMYRMVHMLLRKHQQKEMIVRMKNKYVEVNPTTWRERYDMTVSVGIGNATREKKLLALEKILSAQMQAAQMGTSVVGPEQAYNTLIDYTEALGLGNAQKYWQDPSLIPPSPPQSDPQMEALKLQGQAMVMEAQAKKEANQVQLMKIQSEERLQIASYQQKQQEIQLRVQIEEMKKNLQLLKSSSDAQRDGNKQGFEEHKLVLESHIRGLEATLKNQQEESKRELEQYRAELQSWTQLEQQRMSLVGQQAQSVSIKAKETEDNVNRTSGDIANFTYELNSALSEIKRMLDESRAQLETASSPRKRVIKRDSNGIAISIDEIPIIRGEDGLITGIG